MVTVKKTEFKGWKNCVSISNGNVEMIVTTDVGPRIISYTCGGGENHFKVFDETAGATGGDEWIPYGGHRVWHAPEDKPRSYQPDNETCVCELKDNGVTVMSTEEKTLLSKGFEITMNDDGVVTVNNVIKNDGMFDIELSIWALSQFAHGGLLAVPNSSLDTGLIANRAVSMWPYSKMNDRRVYFGDKFITVVPDKKKTPAFKFGSTVDDGYACYFNHGQLVAKKFEYYYDVEYPNYGCNFESYTNEDFIEIESLTPLFTLEAGEVAVHTEMWAVMDNVKCPERTDEKTIERHCREILKKF